MCILIHKEGQAPQRSGQSRQWPAASTAMLWEAGAVDWLRQRVHLCIQKQDITSHAYKCTFCICLVSSQSQSLVPIVSAAQLLTA